jgi:hypothetical protein
MRCLFLLIALVGYFSTGVWAEELINLNAEKVKNPTLVKILNSAKLQELNALPSAKRWGRQLGIRLYSIGISGSCIPETHMICSHQYYLAVSEYDEAPEQAVYDLGTVGEIIEVQWLQDRRVDRARINIVVSNYPLHAYMRNSRLVPKTVTYALDVGVNSLKINALQKVD